MEKKQTKPVVKEKKVIVMTVGKGDVLKIEKGDIILIAQPNIPDTLALFYAVNKIGAIANMVHPFTPYNQIRKIMNDIAEPSTSGIERNRSRVGIPNAYVAGLLSNRWL